MDHRAHRPPGALTVEAAGSDSHESQACADLGLTYTFAYGNGTLTRTDRIVGDAGECKEVD